MPMLNIRSVYGAAQNTYGNIAGRYATIEIVPYKWGSWKVRNHYQEPLTRTEEIRVEQHIAPPPVIDHTPVINRLRDGAAAKAAAENYKAAQRANEARVLAAAQARANVAKTARLSMANDDNEAFFLMMH